MSAIREIQQAASALYERSEISASKTAQRFKAQRDIEAAIIAFRPDFCEAAEILDAIRASHARRYEEVEGHSKVRLLDKAAQDYRDALKTADEWVPQ